MTETIKVIINPDGISCKEVNPLGKQPEVNDPNPASQYFGAQRDDLMAWKLVEGNLRTFEIIAEPIFNKQDAERERLKWIPGSIHTAQILDNGKVKIVE